MMQWRKAQERKTRKREHEEEEGLLCGGTRGHKNGAQDGGSLLHTADGVNGGPTRGVHHAATETMQAARAGRGGRDRQTLNVGAAQSLSTGTCRTDWPGSAIFPTTHKWHFHHTPVLAHSAAGESFVFLSDARWRLMATLWLEPRLLVQTPSRCESLTVFLTHGVFQRSICQKLPISGRFLGGNCAFESSCRPRRVMLMLRSPVRNPSV